MADELVNRLMQFYGDADPLATGSGGFARQPVPHPDIVNALAQPSTADILARYEPPAKPWGGLKSYMPEQPDWMKTAQNYLGRGLEAIPESAALASNFLVPGMKVPMRAPRVETPIRAYHGSPHDFNEFDLSKIGTGEGAQAYGHGLYFAEHEPVARQYRDQLADQAPGTPAERFAASWLNWTRGDAKEAAAMARQEASFPDNKAHAADLVKAAALLESGDFKPSGRMYEVALHATPEQFLDWDRPMAGQSPSIREFGSRALGRDTPDASGESFLRMLEQANTDVVNPGIKPHAAMSEAGIPGIKYLDQGSRQGSSIARLDGQPIPNGADGHAAHVAASMLNDVGSAREAIAVLERSAANARYPDEIAQTATAAKLLRDGRITLDTKAATSNYVVWSPEIIEILRKYGLLGPAALGAANALAPDKSQQ